MKKLDITKEHFEKSEYFTQKYGKLKFVSESGRLFKTDKGHVIRFSESMSTDDAVKVMPSASATDVDLIPTGRLTHTVPSRRAGGMKANERAMREVMPMNGRKSFGRKAMEEEDENGFTLYSYGTPVARLERRDDGAGLDFCLLDDYLSSTTLTHIHSWLIGHNRKDIPTKKLLELPIGQEVTMMAALESSGQKNLVKEGPGAGYTVTIKDARLANAKVINRLEDGDWEFEADIVKDSYKVEAEDYYNRFCPISEYDEEWVEVAGKVYGVCWWYDDERDVERQVNGQEQDIGFDYGGGWTHVDLPKDGHITADRIRTDEHDTWAIQSIELFAPQVSECVNYCHEHFLDEEEGGGEEEVDESRLVKETSMEFKQLVDDINSMFNKNALARMNSDGELVTVECRREVDKEVQEYIKAACEANGWHYERIARRMGYTYRIDRGDDVAPDMYGDDECFKESNSDDLTLDDIYQAVKSEYGGKLFSDNFLKLNVVPTPGQVICMFELKKPHPTGIDDEEGWWEDKKGSAILFYDELVKFLVDKFGERFRFTDPRVSGEYADKSNPKGAFEILVDSDDTGLPLFAIDEVADGWYAESSGGYAK